MLTHARRGRGWEARLRVWHDEYRRKGLAWVVHTSPGIKRVGGSSGDMFGAVYSSKGPPDFVGVIGSGQAVVFDAKETDAARWATSALPPHQAADLEAVRNLGAFAFIALRLGPKVAQRAWLVPWACLRDVHGSIGVEQLQEIGTPIGPNGWLGCLS